MKYIKLLPLLLVFVSCIKQKNKDLTFEDYTADWAGQVINSRFTMADVIDQANNNNNLNVLIEGEDIILSYSDSVEAQLSEEYYQIQDDQETMIATNTDLNIPAGALQGQTFGPETVDLSYQLNQVPLDFNGTAISDAEIKEIAISSGQFFITLDNSFSSPLTMGFSFPSIIQDGQTLEFDITVQPNSSTSRTFDLTDDIINLKDPNTQQLNFFRGEVVVSGVVGPGGVSIGDQVEIVSGIRDVSYDHIIGNLGRFSIPLDSGSNAISLFDDFDENTEFNIEAFTVRATTETDWGIPMGLQLQELNFLNTISGEETGPLQGLDEVVTIPALESLDEVGQNTVITTKEWSRAEYPSLGEFFEQQIRPNRFTHDVDILANPDDIDSEDMFISRNSMIYSKLEGLFYLYGWLRGFQSADTVDMDISLDTDITTVDNVVMRFILDNGLPVGYRLDVVFLDSLDRPIESIINKVDVEGARVDEDGNVVERVYNLIDVPLDDDQVENIINNGKKAVLVSFLETTDADQGTNVRITPADDVHTIIGLKVGVSVNLDETLAE